MNKLPQVTLLFWVMKICATTLGETGGDMLSMTLNIGYAASTILLLSIFVVTLVAQLRSRHYHPTLYWLVILSTSTAGTTMSDFMDRSLGLGYALGSSLLAGLLCAVLLYWKWSEKSIAMTDIRSFKSEFLYWSAILVSNTLGTALGDYLADSSGLGFAGGAALIGGSIALIALAYYVTSISTVVLFWIAFVLTRPLGATMGDLMTKPLSSGGFNLGTYGSSAVLFAILAATIVYSQWHLGRNPRRLASTS